MCEVGQRKSTARECDCQILPLLQGSTILHFHRKKKYGNTFPFRNIHFDFQVKSTPSCKYDDHTRVPIRPSQSFIMATNFSK